MNPTAPEFNISSFSTNQTINYNKLRQEEIFIQLQNLATAKRNIQHQIDTYYFPLFTKSNGNFQLAQYQQLHILNPVYYLQVHTEFTYHTQQLTTQQTQIAIYDKSIIQLRQEYHALNNTQTVDVTVDNDQPIPQKRAKTLNVLPTILDEEEDENDYNDVSPSMSPVTPTPSNNTDIQHNDHVQYNVLDLIHLRPDFLDLNDQSIPNTIRIPDQSCMEDIAAMFQRKSLTPWLSGVTPVCNKDKLSKKLKGTLNKMTPEKYDKIAKCTMDIISEFAETRDSMKTILNSILSFAIKQSVFASQYAKLIAHLHDYLPRLGIKCDYEWVIQDNNISATFRTMVIMSSQNLFLKHKQYQLTDDDKISNDNKYIELKKQKKKNNFFAVLMTIAELYNYNMISIKIIYEGLFETLLPPNNKNITQIDIEGLCNILRRCGEKLDEERSSSVDLYLNKLTQFAAPFDFRTKCLVDQLKDMRKKQWEEIIKRKEKATTIKEIHDKHYKEQHDKEIAKRKSKSKRSNIYNNHNNNYYSYDASYDDGYGYDYQYQYCY